MAHVTIPDTSPRVQYTVGTTSTTDFSIPFAYFEEGDIVVYVGDTLQTLTTDYTITGTAVDEGFSGGTVVLNTGVTSTTVTVVRDVPIERITDFPTNGPFNITQLNSELDRITAQIQQVDDRNIRAITAPDSDPESINLELPVAADRADKILQFDVDGNPDVVSSTDLVAGLSGSIVGANYVTNSATGDGSTVNFTTSVAAGAKGNIQIYIDGVYQNKASFSLSGTTVTFTEAPPLNASVEFIIGYSIGSTTGDASGVNFTQQGTGAVTTTVAQKLWETVSVKDFGAAGDGVTDDTAAIQAAIDAVVSTGGKLIFPKANYVISATLTVNRPIIIEGNHAQIYQATANTDLFVFDKGATGAGNYQYVYDVRNLVVRTAAGTGDAFVFRNTNESYFENLYVVGCGNTAFNIQGCILSEWNHCYVGNGLTASPGFFTSGASGNVNGFVMTSYEGLGPNTNTFTRCTATNSTGRAFDIAGTTNTFIGTDCEGITSPAIAMYVDGLSTNIIGGNLEGTGGGISVQESNCTIKGINVLGGITVPSGVYGTNIIGGNVKQLQLEAGSFNNTVIGARISTGGFLIDNGTDNLKLNVYNTVSTAEVGMFRSGSFTPDLEFGGASGVSTYFQNRANWWLFGNIVHFNIWLQVDALTAATGSAKINMNDIPYTPSGSANIPCSWSGNGVPVGSGYGNIVPVIDAGTKLIELNKVLDSTGIATSLDEGDFTSGDQILVSGFFPLTLNT